MREPRTVADGGDLVTGFGKDEREHFAQGNVVFRQQYAATNGQAMPGMGHERDSFALRASVDPNADSMAFLSTSRSNGLASSRISSR